MDKFWNNIHSFDLKRMLVELNSEKIALIPYVLCPWGCTEFCFEVGHTNLGILIQQHLQKVVLYRCSCNELQSNLIMINHYVAFYHKISNKNFMSIVKMKYTYVYGSYPNPSLVFVTI